MASMGSSTAISSAPTPQPMNAPTIGINAVKPINTEMSGTYGMLSSDITTAKISPRITASRHCPVKKLEKMRLLRLAISRVRAAVLSGKKAYRIIRPWRESTSCPNKI